MPNTTNTPATPKHPDEMSDSALQSLGFTRKPCPHGREYWTHARSAGKFYYHILTPDAVSAALIEIGHEEFRRRATTALAEMDMDAADSD